MLYVGVDPGTPLTVALWRPEKDELSFLEGERIAFQEVRGKKSKVWNNSPMLLADALYEGLGEDAEVRAVVEAANPRPGQGVSSTAKYVGSAWLARGVLAAYRVPTAIAHPSVWKRSACVRLSQDKELSRRRAVEIFPNHANLFTRKKDHNRAEAALLVYWLKEKHGTPGVDPST